MDFFYTEKRLAVGANISKIRTQYYPLLAVELHSNKVSIEHKEKIRQEIFDMISQNDKGEITLEQLKLFIANLSRREITIDMDLEV